MITIDAECNCWTCADQTPELGKIRAGANGGELQHIPLTLPSTYTLKMTG